MKFQRCDKCGKEKQVGNTSNLADYDTLTFGSYTEPAETFDVCPECKQEIRARFPMKEK